ncbi:MAG TPA: alpha/beta hydrolase [Burkholderiales bacterium]|nr:alpha/beta hydrolase [Burkholderiales bacterium]
MARSEAHPQDEHLHTGGRPASHAVLVVPGLGNSGPGHWQTLWQNVRPDYRRVTQRDWNDPDLEAWAGAVDEAVQAAGVPCLFIAHSFGCLAVAHRALRYPGGIAGALLVAPADPQRWNVAREAIAGSPFDFPSILVASETDPWVDIGKARNLARQWGSRFVNVGAAGHINVDAGYGPWPEGKRLFESLRAAVDICTPIPADWRW